MSASAAKIAYRAANREKIAAGKRVAYKKNKGHVIGLAKEWKAKNPGRYNAIQKKYRDNHKAKISERSRGFHLKKKYGISEAGLLALLDAQGGACAICRTKEWQGRAKRPVVDHNHKTGMIRGILCHNCNVAIGLAEDDPERLGAMAAYLKRQRPAGATE